MVAFELDGVDVPFSQRSLATYPSRNSPSPPQEYSVVVMYHMAGAVERVCGQLVRYSSGHGCVRS